MPLSTYSFHEGIVVRSPLHAMSKKTDPLIQFKNDKLFQEALYLSSPGLYNRLQQVEDGHQISQQEIQKLDNSLQKYWKRMCTRVTPFGMFAACGVAYWSDLGAGVTLSESKFKRHSRLDMGFLCDLAQKIEEDSEIQDHLRYYPNSSIYMVGEDFRFLESEDLTSRTSFKVSSVGCSSHLNGILTMAQEGVTLMEVIGHLVSEEGVSPDQARMYVEEIVECQLLVSELEPSVTGDEYFDQLTGIMERISNDSLEANKYYQYLLQLKTELHNIDKSRVNDIAAYHRLNEIAGKMELKPESGKFIQVDSFLDLDRKTVPSKIQSGLKDGLRALMVCGRPYQNKDLDSFIGRFRDRYDYQLVPLGEALDPESGIGYPEPLDADLCSLLSDLPYESAKTKETIWDPYEKWSLDILTESQKNRKEEVIITEEQLAAFPEKSHDLPPSIPIVFKMIDKDKNTIQIDTAGGSSAVNLLGRFGHGHPEIGNMVEDIASKEQERNPGVIFAEIAHLPESRTGNILQRPNLRSYEIPYLAKSAVGEENQLAIQDLFLKVSGNQLQLWSRKLGKRIIPRLSTAHNFNRTNLPIYKLLCDLQIHEQNSTLSFNWGSLTDKFHYFPRVKFKNVILSAATWKFESSDLQALLSAPKAQRSAKLEELCTEWQIPNLITWSEGDQDLFLDLTQFTDREMLLKLMEKNEKVVLKEFLGNEKSILTDQSGEPHATQMIGCLVSDGPSYKNLPDIKFPVAGHNVQRKFAPASEWLYYKLYCSPATMDRVLTETIQPLMNEFYRHELIDKWFFVRYDDGEPHLRIRLHLTQGESFELITKDISEELMELEASRMIWRTEIATYERELERYGFETMPLCEKIFHCDSEVACMTTSMATQQMNEDLRWQVALSLIHELYDSFGIDMQKRFDMTDRSRLAFYKEFEIDKQMKRYMDNKFRDQREMISQSIQDPAMVHGEEIAQVIRVRSERLRELMPKINYYLNQEGVVSLESLLDSIAHMLVNKIMGTRQRFYEMVIYHFLAKYYKSEMAKSEKMAKVA